MDKIRVVSERQFRLIGQIAYERAVGPITHGAGIRLYQGLDPEDQDRQFLCVEDADSGEEAWYRIDGAQVVPVSLEGMERLPENPR